MEPPPLANYTGLSNYVPQYGDFVIKSGLFSAWTGIVSNVGKDHVDIIFAGLPFLLFTMDRSEHEKNTHKVPIGKIKQSAPGTWAIKRHDAEHNTTVWYI